MAQVVLVMRVYHSMPESVLECRDRLLHLLSAWQQSASERRVSDALCVWGR